MYVVVRKGEDVAHATSHEAALAAQRLLGGAISRASRQTGPRWSAPEHCHLCQGHAFNVLKSLCEPHFIEMDAKYPLREPVGEEPTFAFSYGTKIDGRQFYR